MEEAIWRGKHGRGYLAGETWKRLFGGGNMEEAIWLHLSTRVCGKFMLREVSGACSNGEFKIWGFIWGLGL
jgi:hypothetical protein